MPRRRDRLRLETVAEIKRLAWGQIADNGAAALSLRAVAREMGMTSSALYRYYESRDQLLEALATDAFASLADSLEETEGAESDGGDLAYLRVARAYRSWALGHPTEYALMFGGPTPGLDTDHPETKQEMFRGISVLLRCMGSGLTEGRIHPRPLSPAVDKVLRTRLREWADRLPGHLPPEALAACMFAWTQLHGAISLELFEHMPPELLPADELFEHLIDETLRMFGADSA